MNIDRDVNMRDPGPVGDDSRTRLLAGLPVSERRLQVADVSTVVLEGGEGRSMVLLHGPGELAAHWLPVLSDLVGTHLVIIPDLPGHGAWAREAG